MKKDKDVVGEYPVKLSRNRFVFLFFFNGRIIFDILLIEEKVATSFYIQYSLGPQNHEKGRFYTPKILVVSPKNEGCGFPW